MNISFCLLDALGENTLSSNHADSSQSKDEEFQNKKCLLQPVKMRNHFTQLMSRISCCSCAW